MANGNGNPMGTLQAFPGPRPMIAQGVATGQPTVGYTRAAQWGKYFAYVHQFLPLPASSVRAQRSFSVDGSYDFLIQKVAASFTNGAVLLQTQVSPMGEVFEQAPIYGAGWGSGQHPEIVGGGRLRPPHEFGVPEVLSRNSVFTLFATDGQIAPADQNVLLCYHGTKVSRAPLIPARKYAVAKPFKYPATFDALTSDNNGNPTGPIPAGQTRIFTIVVDQEGDFDVSSLTVVADTSVTVSIVSDSDNWFLSPLPLDLLGGSLIETTSVPGQFFSGQYPFVLPGPRLITSAGYIQVTVSNLDLVNATRCQVVFHGQRLYPSGGL